MAPSSRPDTPIDVWGYRVNFGDFFRLEYREIRVQPGSQARGSGSAEIVTADEGVEEDYLDTPVARAPSSAPALDHYDDDGHGDDGHGDDDHDDDITPDVHVPLFPEVDDVGEFRIATNPREREILYVPRTAELYKLEVHGLAQIHGRLSPHDPTPISILAFELRLFVPGNVGIRSIEFNLSVSESAKETVPGMRPEIIEFAPKKGLHADRNDGMCLEGSMTMRTASSAALSTCRWLWGEQTGPRASAHQGGGSSARIYRVAVAIQNPRATPIVVNITSKAQTRFAHKLAARLFGQGETCIDPRLPTEGRQPFWTQMGLTFLEEILSTDVVPSDVGAGVGPGDGASTRDHRGHGGIVDDEVAPDVTSADTPTAANTTTEDAAEAEASTIAMTADPNTSALVVPVDGTTANPRTLDPTTTGAAAATDGTAPGDEATVLSNGVKPGTSTRPYFEKPPKLLRESNFYLALCGLVVTRNGRKLGCVRTATLSKTVQLNFGGWTVLMSENNEGPEVLPSQKVYFVMGIFDPWNDQPRETLVKVTVKKPNTNFCHDISRATRSLRGLRRFLSLKSVARFGIYRCEEGARHIHVDDDPVSEHYLCGLYEDWRAGSVLHGEWGPWIMANLNCGSPQPAVDAYSIRLILRWDIYRICIAIMLPVVASIISGVAYQELTGDIQTAWTVASYVVTSVGVVAALLAIGTSLGPV